jgi:hypothetical protein
MLVHDEAIQDQLSRKRHPTAAPWYCYSNNGVILPCLLVTTDQQPSMGPYPIMNELTALIDADMP